MRNFLEIAPKAIKWLLFATILTPLIISPSLMLFPFVFGKTLFFRILISIATILGLSYLACRAGTDPKNTLIGIKSFFRDPLNLAVIVFFFAMTISTFFALSPFKAFFGDIERGEGLYTLLHYLSYYILLISVFSKKDWTRFAIGTIGAGIVVSFVALLQYVGFGGLPSYMPSANQPGSLLGNPAYVGSMVVLMIGFFGILIKEGFAKTRTQIISGASALILLIFTLLLTSERGPFLGLLAGIIVAGILVIFNKKYDKKLKIGISISFAVLVVFGGIFWTTRSSDVWTSVPALGRLSKLSLQDSTTQERLISWGSGIEAFEERPVFGFGSDNYNFGYNNHFDPHYSYYSETWFDRAHNKLIELSVMYGGVGLVAYLVLFGIALWYSRKNIIVFGVLIAYFVQNLVLFDNVVSYVHFFALLAWISWINKKAPGGSASQKSADWLESPAIILAVVGSILILYGIYAWNIIPMNQIDNYKKALSTKSAVTIIKSMDSFYEPFNYLQPTLRAQVLSGLRSSGNFTKPEARELSLKALKALEDSANIEKYEPRQYVGLVEAYDDLAKIDPSFYDKALEYSEKALQLSPSRQGILYHYAFDLASVGRYEVAVAASKKAIDLDPSVFKSHYQYAIILSVAADAPEYKDKLQSAEWKKEAVSEIKSALAEAENKGYGFFAKTDFSNAIVVLKRVGERDLLVKTLEAAIEKYPDERGYYLNLVIAYRDVRDADGLIKTAEKLKELEPQMGSDIDKIIDLAKKKDWASLDKMDKQ